MKVLTPFPLIILLLFLLNIPCRIYAQTPVVEWQKCLGGKNGDYSWSIEATTDGGYITAGYTEGPDDGDILGYHGNPMVNDIWVVRLNGDGSMRWQKCLGSAYMETGASIHETPDGGFIVAGSSASRECSITGTHGGLDYWVVKLNARGDILWQKMYGGTRNEYAYGISLAKDGGYIVAGLTESSDGDVTGNHGGRDYWVIKLDGAGTLQWQKALGGSGDEEAYSVQATADGGCIAAGFTESVDGDITGNHGGRDYWVVKLSNTGSLQWQKCLGGSSADIAWSVRLAKDGGYVVAGGTISNDGNVSGNHGGRDYWIVKLDGAGNMQWQKCYGGSFNELAYCINTTPDGGYVIVGNAESANGDVTCNSGATDLWIIKISSTGSLEWQKPMGGDMYDEGYFVQALNDGSFIICGATCSSNISGHHPYTGGFGTCTDFWIIKLTAPVAIAPPPKLTVSYSGKICSGAATTFSALALYAGTNPYYQWMKNGTAVGTNSSTYSSSSLTNGDVIACRVTSGGPCETGIAMQAAASIVINTSNAVLHPQVTIKADNTAVCNCSPVTFNASVANGGTEPLYQWMVNGSNSGNIGSTFISSSLRPGDVVNCVYRDNSGCVANGSATSNAVTISGGTGSAPAVTIAASQNPVCEGTAIAFTASPVYAGAAPSYQWKINGVNTGTNQPVFSTASYQNGDIVSCILTADPSFACATVTTAGSNPITMTITKKATPSVNITTAADTICTGTPVSFLANTTNAGKRPSFQWKVNAINAGTNDSSFMVSSLVNGDIITCSIVSDPSFACVNGTTAGSNSITMTVTAASPPAVTITVSGNNVCSGTMLTFTATAANAGASPAYLWTVNNSQAGKNLPLYTTASLQNGDQVFCEMIPGKNACSTSPVTSGKIVMTIKDLPAVHITPADTIVAAGTELQLNATVAGQVAGYSWSPSWALQPPLSLAPKTIRLTENMVFTLEVQNAAGCSASASSIVKVGRVLKMPNAFTPNGDGLNEVFRIPPGTSLALSEFSVYDRWGNKVFATQDLNKGWDGYYKGEKAEVGVYVYIIKGSDDKGKVFLKGTVCLVR